MRIFHPERKVWWVINRRIFGKKIHLLHGSVAWELQIGTHVFQWFYEPFHGTKRRHWIDSYEKER